MLFTKRMNICAVFRKWVLDTVLRRMCHGYLFIKNIRTSLFTQYMKTNSAFHRMHWTECIIMCKVQSITLTSCASTALMRHRWLLQLPVNSGGKTLIVNRSLILKRDISCIKRPSIRKKKNTNHPQENCNADWSDQ